MGFVDVIKRTVQRRLARAGRTIAPIGAVSSPQNLLRGLAQHRFEPGTVFDVGVAEGTPWLYEAFPKATFHLIDPTREALPHMERWAQQLSARVHNVALGAADGELPIRTRSTIEHATLLRDVTEPPLDASYAVPLRRFDGLFSKIEQPNFCKIDVEGFERDILIGMGDAIQSLDVVVIETSLNTLYDNGADFSEIMEIMKERGFELFDVCGATRRPFDSALHQIDAAFVPTTSAMRVKRWA